jgi:hypothetical protein
MNRRSTVIGVFNYPSDAQDAICELRQLGFYDFGLMSPLNGGEAQTRLWSLRITFAEIPVIGPIVAAGPLADALIGAVGGIVGALIGLGIGEEDAVFYEEELQKGRTLVTLRAIHREEEAWMIMEYYCAYRHDIMLTTA